MTDVQQLLIGLFTGYAAYASVRSYNECRHKRRAFTLTPQYYLLGAFVWGDVLVFGPFWFAVSVIVLYLQDWLLFCFIVSLFWLVRSFGETMYWFHQQFSTINRNPPKYLPGYFLVGNDAIWFVYQIAAQCVTVASIVAAVYFGTMWIQSFSM